MEFIFTKKFVEEFYLLAKVLKEKFFEKDNFYTKKIKNKEKIEQSIPPDFMTCSDFARKFNFISSNCMSEIIKEVNIKKIHTNCGIFINPLEFIQLFENGYFSNHARIMKKFNDLKNKLPELIEIRKLLPFK
ncbi:hypothetical protein EBR77_00690 [bacterium]|nr:hypothetical protein [bacterium]